MRVDILCGWDILKIENEVDHVLQDEQNCDKSEFHNHGRSASILLIQQQLVSVLDEFMIFLLFLAFPFFQFFLFMLIIIIACGILHASEWS